MSDYANQLDVIAASSVGTTPVLLRGAANRIRALEARNGELARYAPHGDYQKEQMRQEVRLNKEIADLSARAQAAEARCAAIQASLVDVAETMGARVKVLEEALRSIAESPRWGEDTAIKRTISYLQDCAKEALAPPRETGEELQRQVMVTRTMRSDKAETRVKVLERELNETLAAATIEAREADKARERVKVLGVALQWYADENHYDVLCATLDDPTFKGIDHEGDARVEDGSRARAALALPRETGEKGEAET